MRIQIELITGFMIGFELVLDEEAAMIDLGFFRILFDWQK